MSPALRLLLPVLAVFVLLLGTSSARAAIFTVTNTAHSGDGSLRKAMADAEAAAGADSIVFAAAVGETFATRQTIALSSGMPAVTSDLTITGSAAGVTITRPHNTALFINSGVVNLVNLSFTTSNGTGLRREGGTLTARGCTFFGSSQGIVIGGTSTATTVATLENCTISGNTTGIEANSGTVITSCTISGNILGLNYDGGLGTATVTNSIIAGNNTNTDTVRPITNGGNNILTGTAITAGLENTGATSPTLKDNGGPTNTIALIAGSPAVDAGDASVTGSASTYDQRGVGFLRVRRGRLDIGAFEVQNERPSFSNFTKDAAEDTTTNFTLSDFSAAFSGPENSDTLARLQIVSLPEASAGVLQLNSANVSAGQIIAAADIAKLSFVPVANFNGNATFDILGADAFGFGVGQTAARVTLQVLAVNDAPTVVNQTRGTDEDTPLTITFTASDVDSSSFTFEIVSGPSNGTLSGSGATRTYTPRLNFVGSDSFTFRANDGSANSNTATSNTATVTITVGGQNDAPVAVDDTASTSEDVPVSIQVLANDTDDEGDALTVQSVAVTSATNGTVSISADKKSVLFTPALNFSGTSAFSYTASDGTLDSNAATVTVQVLGTNDAPVAVADSYRVTGRSLSISAAAGVLQNDTDDEGDALQAVLARAPAHGSVTLNRDGSFTYIPAETFIGSDSFAYVALDANGQSAPSVVSLSVTGTIVSRDNTPPIVSLAGAATRTLRALPTIRGSAVDRYAVVGRGVVASSGLKSVVIRLQNAGGLFFNGRTFQTAAFNLATRQVGRSFFELARSMPTVVPEGRYTITAIATDKADNVSRATQTVLVDSPPPSLLITTPAAGANNTATVARLSSIGGQSAGAVRVAVALRNAAGRYFDGTSFSAAVVFAPATLSGSNFSLSLPANLSLAPGRYLILVRAVDAAGNPANASRTVIVQSSPSG